MKMNENFFISKAIDPLPYESKWEAPSNIALIKYWGKKNLQIPKNPSLSFTLDKSVTKTSIRFEPSKSGKFNFKFFFNDSLKPDFDDKLHVFFDRIKKYVCWITNYELTIKSINTFPHSSGIASSASAMAALSLAIMDLESYLFNFEKNDFFFTKASFLARIGSGSASRSIKGPVTIWGNNRKISNSSDLYAIEFGEDLNSIFKSYQDIILLVDKESKNVSSTKGHDLMHSNPYAAKRFLQARRNFDSLIPIMKSGDLDAFIKIIELEALSLHAMMMTSNPYYILMKPNTLSIIEKLWDFRKEKNIPACFTMDAGANVHILYPLEYEKQMIPFINQELSSFCKNKEYIVDQVGTGARKLD